MATSARAKADDRAKVAVSAIKDALYQGNGAEALAKACAYLRSEAAHMRRHGPPAETILLDAQLAGMLAGYAVVLRDCQPPHAAIPRGSVFATSFEQAVTGVTPVTGGARVA
jgi:hypothetical protein